MTVRVHIERLVLTGLPVTAGEAATVRRIVGDELVRLLAGGMATELTRGGALPELPAVALTMPRAPGAVPLAGRIAGAVYAALQPASPGVGAGAHRSVHVSRTPARGQRRG